MTFVFFHVTMVATKGDSNIAPQKKKEYDEMKTLGNSRQSDALGRIVLPKDMRRALKLNENDYLDIVLEGNAIKLTKTTHSCAICGETEDLILVKRGYVCASCKEHIVNNQ
ncbi:MAG TPA: AbrB family transcriptional regulator [Clostridiales bacterium]|nr:AbrB family transcriptional regulator [Clostridiales bacterium]